MKNIYTKATKENLEKLLNLGCNFGIDTEKGLLSGDFIAVNNFGNLYSFSEKMCIKQNLSFIEKI